MLSFSLGEEISNLIVMLLIKSSLKTLGSALILESVLIFSAS